MQRFLSKLTKQQECQETLDNATVTKPPGDQTATFLHLLWRNVFVCLAIVPFSHCTCKHGSTQARYPRLCTAAQTGHRGLLLLGVVSFQLHITIVTPWKTVMCVFAGKKKKNATRPQRTSRSLGGSTTSQVSFPQIRNDHKTFTCTFPWLHSQFRIFKTTIFTAITTNKEKNSAVCY